MPKNQKNKREQLADGEYNRLVELYREANVDELKLKIYDSLIRKVAETFACLEAMKDLPTIIFDPKNPHIQRETAAGKSRVKYMAQYTSAMQKLNKELLGEMAEDEDDLSEFE